IKFEAKVNGVGQSFDTARMIFEPNTYYLITFQKEGNTGRIFINNTEVAQKTDFTVDLSKFVYNKYGSDVDYKIDIGGNSVWGDSRVVEEGLQGELDEFRIYDRAISAGEVNHIYSSFATKAGTTPYASLGDEGTEVVYAFNTVANFSGFRDNVASSKGDNQWRGKALADGSVLATRYGGSDHFLWGPRIPEAKRTKIVTGSTYYIKTLVKVSNTDRIKDKTAGENVFDFNTVGGKVSATFDKATFDANPAFYGGKLLKEGEWIPLVWSFTATDATDRGIEWSMLSQMGVSNNNSMDYFLQISNKIVISENSIALAPPSGPTVSPYFGADNGDISKTSQWDQGKDVYYAWDLNFVGGQDRRIRVPDGSTVALESNHIYYSMSLPTEKRTIAAGTDYYFKLLLKLDNFKDVDMSKYVLEWDWNDKPIEGQIMPEVLKAKEGEWVSLVYKLNDATKLNTGGEGRFRLQGSRAYKLYGSRYLVLSTDSTPLALPSDVDAAVPVKNSIDNLVKPREIKVEFENLTSIVNDTKATENNADGWVLGNTDVNGTICKYPAIDFDTKVNDTISVRYSAKAMAGSAASYIEFRADDPVTGPVIGTVATPDTGAWTTFKTATGAVTNNVTGVHDVYAIIYKPGVGTDVPQYVGNLNWFSFSSSTEPVLSNEKIPAAKAIRTAYNALTATQKALVSNYETFVSSEVTLGLIQQAADQTAADAVITKIVDLPSANAIKVTDKDAIVAARTAYTALTAAQKALVLNLDALTTAETALAAAENKAAADVVVENIADLPSTSAIKATDEEAIVAARAAYTALTAAQKALVTNLDTLVNAEYVLNLLTSSSSEVGVTGVTLNKTNESLKVGATLALVATIAPDNATNKNVNWFTSNEKVATVDANGNVKAIGNGTATITAITASGTKIAKCTVAVTTPVTSVKLNATTATINKGSSQNLTATINPSTASNKEVQWTSGNKNVATVDSNGKVTAKAFGVTTIYATTSNGLKASCTVYVKGWYQSAGKWYFNDGKGKVTNKWFQDGSKWYYVDTKGVMQTSKWIKSSGKYYYVDSKGVMLTNKWIKSGGKWYYVDKNGIMFVNTSKKIGSKTYKFNKSGACINP
ncbi:MAG: Ig-like surface protein, partial [Oscillospiraceae bacterium]|nr:Ig-like surface protein [Oscillospiraceae bacterium]